MSATDVGVPLCVFVFSQRQWVPVEQHCYQQASGVGRHEASTGQKKSQERRRKQKSGRRGDEQRTGREQERGRAHEAPAQEGEGEGGRRHTRPRRLELMKRAERRARGGRLEQRSGRGRRKRTQLHSSASDGCSSVDGSEVAQRGRLDAEGWSRRGTGGRAGESSS